MTKKNSLYQVITLLLTDINHSPLFFYTMNLLIYHEVRTPLTRHDAPMQERRAELCSVFWHWRFG
jgi:hypothetical protein